MFGENSFLKIISFALLVIDILYEERDATVEYLKEC